MSRAVLAYLLVSLASACGGDDGVNTLPDAPSAVTLAVEPASIVLASGASTMVMATIERGGGFTGDVVISATSPSADLTITGGTIAATETSIALTVTAATNMESTMIDVSVEGAASVAIDPAALAVRIAGLAGPRIGGAMAGEQSGSSVALSADGTRVIIGAPTADTTGTEAGQARVFDRNGNTWTQVGASLDGEAANDRYGGAVAISNDGSRIAIGSYANDGVNGNHSGHVRVFDLVGGAWTQVGADIDGLGGSDGHGWAIALNATGSRVIVGAPTVNNQNGTAHVWDFDGTAWIAVGTPFAGSHELGHEVNISDDGNRVAVSAPSQSASDGAPGTTQIYEWSGTAWTALGAPILGATPAAASGTSVDFNADGSMIAVGSTNTDIGGTNAGDVRVFRWSAADTAWMQVGETLPGLAGTNSGSSVSLSADGTRVLAGGPAGAGNVRLYTREGDTWTLQMVAFGSGARTGDSVSISADGSTAAIGAPYADAPGNISGEVRVYDLP